MNVPAAKPKAALGEVIARLSALHPKRIDLSLDRMHRVLARLDNPEKKVPPVIHVAGTNGKGSTVAYLRAILESAGLRAHVYTSPWLVRINECFRLAGRLVGDDDGSPFELAVADLDRVVHPGAGARILDAVGIALLVAEFQRIGRHLGKRDVVPGLVVEDRFQPRGGAHAQVIIRAGDHHLVRLDVLVEHQLPGIRALDPEVLRRLPPQHVADLRPNDVGEPIHVSLRMAIVCTIWRPGPARRKSVSTLN